MTTAVVSSGPVDSKALSTMVSAISSTVVPGGKSVSDCVAFLLSRRTQAQQFDSIEDLAIATEDPGDARQKDARALVHHIVQVRAAVVRVLWPNELYVGVSVVDDLILDWLIHVGKGDLIAMTLDEIVVKRTAHPGMLIFPATFFGFLDAGFASWQGGGTPRFIAPEFGMALLPQTNNLDVTIDLLDEAAAAFGSRVLTDHVTLQHWHRSRRLKWLTRNPLVVVRVGSLPGDMFEVERHLLAELRRATSFTSMLGVMQPTLDDTDMRVMFSTSRVNSSETLDLRHYLALYDRGAPAAELDGFCVPMHDRIPMAELSALRFELDSDFWAANAHEAQRIYEAVSTIHARSLRKRMTLPAGANDGIFESVVRSMDFFRRSFHDRHHSWAAVTSLATAFEIMLTDGFSSGVRDRLGRRVQTLLDGDTAARRVVEQLYIDRGDVVHAGASIEVDLREAQRVYVRCFVEIVHWLDGLDEIGGSSPIQTLLGDTPPSPSLVHRLRSKLATAVAPAPLWKKLNGSEPNVE